MVMSKQELKDTLKNKGNLDIFKQAFSFAKLQALEIAENTKKDTKGIRNKYKR